MSRLSLLRLVCAGVLIATTAAARSPWLPLAGTGSAAVQVSTQRTERFWRGAVSDRLPSPLRQLSTLVFIEHGLTDDWALDAGFGYARGWFMDNESEGLADSSLGVRYRLLDEFASDHPAAITLTARAGAILQGNYEVGPFWSPGDGASGVEAQLGAGKNFTRGRGLQAALGYRWMGETVPDAATYRISGFVAAGRSVTLSAGLSGQISVSGGPDIFAPDFTAADFPGVREVYHRAEVTVIARLPAGWTLSASLGRDLAGRNTPRRTLSNLSLIWTH